MSASKYPGSFDISKLELELPGYFSNSSQAQRKRMDQKGIWLSQRACGGCQNFRDGLRCGSRYAEVRAGQLGDCWRPVGTILVWDEEMIRET